jgi:hypothetical protein
VLLAALRADRNIGPQVGELVGTEFSTFTLTEDMVTDNLLWRVAERRDGLEFDETTFAEEFGAFVSDLQRTQYEIVVCAPVLGVTLGSPPISLSEELRPLRL